MIIICYYFKILLSVYNRMVIYIQTGCCAPDHTGTDEGTRSAGGR